MIENSETNYESPKLGAIVLYSDNIPESLAFYRALGIQFKQEQHGKGPIHYSADIGGILMEVYPGEAPTRLGFSVDSTDKTVENLSQENIAAKTPAKDSPFGRFATFTDPDGRVIEVRENPNN